MSVTTTYDQRDELGGLLKKLGKIHKKLGGKLEAKVAKKLPGPLRKIEEKRLALTDKVFENKTLNKIVDVAAVVVAAYFTGGAALGFLQANAGTIAQSAVSMAATSAMDKKKAEQAEKAAAAEQAAIENELNKITQEQVHTQEMQAKGLIPVEQTDGSVAWLPATRSAAEDVSGQSLVPVRTASGQTALLPESEVATATDGTFFDRNKTLVIGGGIAALVLLTVMMRPRRGAR